MVGSYLDDSRRSINIKIFIQKKPLTQGFFYFPFLKNLSIFIKKRNIMVTQLKKMIENNEVTEIELVEFVRTLNKLSKNNFMDKRNIKLVTKHFGFKKKKGWLKIEKGNKIQL
jgi:hypothetical protein